MKRSTGSQFQCRECGEHFAGPASFGRHFRRDTAQCQTPDEMRAVGLTLTAAGFWSSRLPDRDFGFDIGFANGGPGEPA